MKKATKIVAGVTAFVLIALLLFFANGFLGNPVSKVLATYRVPRYIERTYPELDLQVGNVTYNFKTGGYSAQVQLPGSVDTHFFVNTSMLGTVLRDDYESTVVSGWNTWSRLNEEYGAMTEAVFGAADFPYISDIDFGTLESIDADVEVGKTPPGTGIRLEDLEIDGQYDVRELAKTAGHIVFYAESDTVNVQRGAEILLELKKRLTEADVPFYTIDFVLQKPRGADGAHVDDTQIGIAGFLFSDIEKEGLEEKLQEAAQALAERYAEEDAKRAEWEKSAQP